MAQLAPKRRDELTVVESAPNRYAARGALTFATAQRALARGIAALAASRGTAIEVDLNGVDASDSAGLAVLIEWRAWARRNGRALRFGSVPETLRTIARISELEELLFGS
jgi:phospholipid transport system transporter-binding protein